MRRLWRGGNIKGTFKLNAVRLRLMPRFGHTLRRDQKPFQAAAIFSLRCGSAAAGRQS
jgi:hypothetical protein